MLCSGISDVQVPALAPTTSPLQLVAGHSEIAEKSKKASEDANFVYTYPDGKSVVMAVADGVGSWAYRGMHGSVDVERAGVFVVFCAIASLLLTLTCVVRTL